MTASHTPNSADEQKRAERLDVARTVHHALAAQDADRVITLCDIHATICGLSRVIQRMPHSDARKQKCGGPI